MAYVDWDDVADAVGGESRLKKNVLSGKVETSEAHPFLATQITRATQYANSKMGKAGLETPLVEPLTDEVLKASIIGLVVGFATEGLSNREPWMEKMFTAAVEYFDELLAGDAEVIGAEESDASDTWSQIIGNTPDDPVFDTSNPYSEVNRVFTNFGPPPRRRW
jgi:hypothetical protein